MTPLEQLQEMVKIQSSPGNWNCSPYMLGFANGHDGVILINAKPVYEWKGEGPEPRRWTALDGTVVYRSYADYIDD